MRLINTHKKNKRRRMKKKKRKQPSLETVWEHGANRVSKKFIFVLLKFNIVCMFWIVLMC
jgi:ATP adenylyltransferase/5',5'''-P-1,P-4-tetraphosphate phosphorylase II